MKQPLIINVGTSRTLSRAVQEILFQAGYKWEHHGQTAQDHTWDICAHGNGKLHSNPDSGAIEINAATEFGRLIELLEDKKIKIGRYEVETYAPYLSSEMGIKCGCVTASKETVRKVRESLVDGSRSEPNIVIKGLSGLKMKEIVFSLLGNPSLYWEGHDRIRVENGKIESQGIKGDYEPGGNNSELAKGYIFIDARTEMGKLIDLLENKETHIMTESGHDAIIRDHKVEIAGETLSKEQVEEIWEALQ